MKAASKVFGVDLEDVLRKQNGAGDPPEIPIVVSECVRWLESRNCLGEEGIFRVPGQGNVVQDIKKQYEAGSMNLFGYPAADVHSVAGVLKLFLRELPEPVFIWRYYTTFIKVIRNNDGEQRLQNLRLLVHGLPKPNKDLLLYLMSFLHRVSQYASTSKMSSANLAMVFAPNLLRPEKETLTQIMEDSNYVTAVIKVMIEEIEFMNKRARKPTLSGESSTADLIRSPGSGLSSSALLASEAKLTARALYPFQGTDPQWHLTIAKDDVIQLIDLKGEEGWLKGELNGKQGYFPASYVELVAAPPPPAGTVYTPLGEDTGVERKLPPPIGARPLTASYSNQGSLPSLNNFTSTTTSTSTSTPTTPTPHTAVTRTQNSPLNGSGSGVIPPAINVSANDILLPPPPIALPVPTDLPLPPPPVLSPSSLPPPPPFAGGGGDLPPPLVVVDELPPPASVPVYMEGFPMPLDGPSPPSSYDGTIPNLDHVHAPVITDPFEEFQIPDTEEGKLVRKRRERANEILTTEQTYVKQLAVVVEHWIKPLDPKHNNPPIIPEDSRNAIFSTMGAFYPLHVKLLEAVHEAMKLAADPIIGSVFQANIKFLKLYRHYINNYENAMRELKTNRTTNEAFKAYATRLDYTEVMSNLSLESFLILPIQRIPRYVLLLQDLMKCTPPVHPDHEALQKALDDVRQFADFVNSDKRTNDNKNKIDSIQATIVGFPEGTVLSTMPRRAFVDEGRIRLNKKDDFYLFMFNDLLVYAKVEKRGYRYKGMINLATCSVSNEEGGVIKIISPEGTLRIQSTADTPKERDKWERLIKDAVESSRQMMLSEAFAGGEQSSASSGNASFLKQQEQEHALKKLKCAQHLLATEEEYVQRITYVQTVFLAPMRKSADSANPIIPLAAVIDIGSNFETLLTCHQGLLTALKKRVEEEWVERPVLGDLFLEKGGFLKLYNYYVTNHTKQLQTIEDNLVTQALFSFWLLDMERKEKADLKTLLGEPLRRLSVYLLDLQEALQYTKIKSEDHEPLSRVLSNLKEQTDRLTHIQNPLPGGEANKDKKKKPRTATAGVKKEPSRLFG